jgi:asparagine synthase (glutamine-hydrolysing)
VPSRVQADVRGLLGGEELFFVLEVAELAAARAGLQLRLPFLDRPLVEWVHAIPWQQRRPDGLMKRLLRDAMAGTWPEELARRRKVTLANEYFAWSVSRSLPLLAPTIEGLRWEAAEFIDHGVARRLLASMDGGGDAAKWRDWLELWDIVGLESWLRHLRD